MPMGKIAVLGGGPGGHAMAGDLALRGYEVHHWGRNPWHMAAVFKYKQIKLVGKIQGTARLANASDNLEEILKGARLILIPLPALAQRDVAERCAPYVEEGQVFVVSAQSGMGSLEFARTFREKGVKKDVLCGEIPGLPYGARFLEPGVVSVPWTTGEWGVYPKGVGVFPARRKGELMALLSELYPERQVAENSLDSALQSIGPISHPVLMLMNATAIETFYYWDAEGRDQKAFTPSAIRVVAAVDEERKAIRRAWGFPPGEVFHPGHLTGETSSRGIPWSQFKLPWEVAVAWRDLLHMKHRFVTEDVAYGLVLRVSAAAKAGVDVPIGKALVHLFSVINGEDYFATGRTLENLGLGAMSVEQIKDFLHQGWQ